MKKCCLLFFYLILFLSVGCPSKKSLEHLKKPKGLPAGRQGKYGGTLILSTTSDPKSFNPIIAKETSTTAITGFLFEGLTETDGVTTEVMPALAKDWEKSADGLTWTFNLRDDVKWFDGEKFSADDVVFTYNKLIYNPEIPTSSRDILTIKGKPFLVEKVSPYKVRFRLSSPFAPFLRVLGQEILPKHILEKTVAEKRFNSTWGINTIPSQIMGTGPFRLKRYLAGQKIILERNPYCWKRKNEERLPYISKIIFLIVPDQNSQLLKFQAGEIDALSLRGQDYSFLKPKERKGNFSIHNAGPALGANFLVFNQNPASPISPIKLRWFTNRKFREAIAYTIDKETMVANVLAGFGYPQDGPMNESCGFFYNPAVKKYRYDLKKAKELLEKIGFKIQNGALFDQEGNRVEFSLLTNNDNLERINIANIIRDDLTKLGMKVHFTPLDFNTLVTKLDASFDWEAVLIGLTGGIEPHSGRNVWASAGQLHIWHPRQKSAASAWEKKIDKIFEEAVRELNRNKRKILYDQWQEIVSKQLPLIYTVNSASLYAVRNKLGNLHPTSYGGLFHNIEEIYIR
ncbi:MAG: ABC transporter substrate-binding protein [Candidatus Omnitrophica bacterium]|nr:ABC transporter substrate-binding protein [Candidatus Omnitrophota bacterium]